MVEGGRGQPNMAQCTPHIKRGPAVACQKGCPSSALRWMGHPLAGHHAQGRAYWCSGGTRTASHPLGCSSGRSHSGRCHSVCRSAGLPPHPPPPLAACPPCTWRCMSAAAPACPPRTWTTLPTPHSRSTHTLRREQGGMAPWRRGMPHSLPPTYTWPEGHS